MVVIVTRAGQSMAEAADVLLGVQYLGTEGGREGGKG
jgi:hypothetical protein